MEIRLAINEKQFFAGVRQTLFFPNHGSPYNDLRRAICREPDASLRNEKRGE
jgi:hypothetical protein